jgi:DNA-binding NarL/FixJ family response regulator
MVAEARIAHPSVALTMKSRTDRGASARPNPLPIVNVLLVDPLAVVRSGLHLLISGEPDLAVVGEAATAEEALETLRLLARRTGVVALVGLNLGGQRDGYWLIREIRESFPSIPVIACGANSDAISISRALFFGADGFVDKTARPEDFLHAIRRGARREMVLEGLPPDWMAPIADGIGRHLDGPAVLTGREREVLTVAAEGLTARQIGSRLGVKERTVTTHLFRIYKKLGADSRVGAIATAARSGIINIAPLE